MAGTIGVYEQIVEKIFLDRFKKGTKSVEFEREDIPRAAKDLGLARPKNLGDVVSAYRFRKPMPAKVTATAPKGQEWTLRLTGHGRYSFTLGPIVDLSPSKAHFVTKVPDATPEIVKRYAMSDEQALLAIVRYNRLIDIFLGITCYSLQNHLRTTAKDIGQVEVDELYVGVDARGVNFSIPVQAKGGSDKLSVVQIEQDIAVCGEKAGLRDTICRPVAAQFKDDGVIVLFELGEQDGAIVKVRERHYRLVPADEISADDLKSYNRSARD